MTKQFNEWRCFGCRRWKKIAEFFAGDRKLCSGCQSNQKIRNQYLGKTQEYNEEEQENEEIDE